MLIQTLICPDNGVEPIEAKVQLATEIQTELVNSKLCLFKAGQILINSLADKELLDSAECDFDGYTAGGVTIAAFGDPIVDAANDSVLLAAPSKQFNYVAGVGEVANDVGGAYLVDANGKLRGVVEFPDPVTLDDNLDGVTVLFVLRV